MTMKHAQNVPWWQVANVVPMITIVVFAGGIIAQHQIIMAEQDNTKQMIRNLIAKVDEFITLEQHNRENILEIESNQVQAFQVLKMAPPTYSK